MTQRTKKILVRVGASIGGLILLLVVAAVVVLQSSWFANFVREKIISVAQESTGGVVELGSFELDWGHLTVRIRNFVLHGTEPVGSDPLVRVPLLELRLRLFSGLKHMVDLQYLGIERPAVNVIVFADGKTNIPEPKVKKAPSQTSGLETVVNLAVGKFNIENGLLEFAQKKTDFSARGENLRLLLNYNALTPEYQGSIAMDPLLLTSAGHPSLGVHVNVPVTIEKDAIRIANGTLNTDASKVTVNASMTNMNAPQITAQVNATVGLAEMQRSFALPIAPNAKGAPNTLTADASVQMDTKNNVIAVNSAHLGLGQTTFVASGTMDPAKNTAVTFSADLNLRQLERLLKVASPEASGELALNGTARMDAHNNYDVNGTLNSRAVALRSGTMQIPSVSLYAPFHADPYLISVDGLRLNVLGGSLAAKVFIQNMQRLSMEGDLRNFSLPVLAATFAGDELGYDGTIDGSLKAQGDLKATGTTGYAAQAHLAIVPGTRGVPVSGRIDANYAGSRNTVEIGRSYVALPHTRLDISGGLNKRIDLDLVSHNLNDFLPAVNFGAKKPQTSLPVALSGGAAEVRAQLTGNLSGPHITSHVEVNQFAVEGQAFNRFAAELAASSSGAAVKQGVLDGKALGATFDASIGLAKWKPLARSPLSANLAVQRGDLAGLLAVAGESTIPASGQVTANININGSYGNPLGGATLQVGNGSVYNQPFDRIYANVALADQLITISNVELDAAGGKLNVSGTFRHPRDSFSVGQAQLHVTSTGVQLANIEALKQEHQGIAGSIQLAADAAADIRQVNNQSQVTVSNISADLSGTGLRVQNQDAGNLTATARTANGSVNYRLASNFAGSNLQLNGRTSLASGYATTADASIQNLSVAKTLEIVGQGTIPASGNLTANAHVAGTLQRPSADLSFALTRAHVYEETINRLQGSLRYSNTLLEIPSLRLDMPAGNVSLTGSFQHPPDSYTAGALQLNVSSSDIQLARIEHVEAQQRGLAGTVHLFADVAANVSQRSGRPSVRFSKLNADISAKSLRMNGRSLGQATMTAATQGTGVAFRADSDIAQAQIHGNGQAQLANDYPIQAKLTFDNIRYSNLAPFISTEPEVKPNVDALVGGQVSVSGPLTNLDDLTGQLRLNTLEAHTQRQTSATGAPVTRAVSFHNDGPIVVGLNHSAVQVQQFKITGPGTSISASGGINLKNGKSPVGLTLDANADLGVLQDVDRDFYSSGSVVLNATVRGTFSQPLVNGRVELKNANVNYASAPNGLSNANGVILLNGTNASIQNLTAESGGGKIAVTGFVGIAGTTLNYNLRAAATRVRTRYSGLSATASASVTLTGNSHRSRLGGTVTIQRIAYAATSDAGSLLSTAATPPSTPSAPSGLLAGMRLDVHIRTAPDMRVISTYTDRVEVFADLNVRGTAANPGILGRVNITNGQLVFFGNTYTVQTGAINFYDPTAIQPVLNISLETIAQGVDVVIGVSGPMNDLKLSYRSDPPLTFEQIVQLLATNTTPADPTIAAHQPTPPQQSMSQMGESAVLSQAVANPLASRVQRVFGLTQFKIDPSFSGNNGQPDARVTLQEKVTSDITFTYITDVSQTNGQIVRVEWDLTPKLSAVGLRDYNGNVSVEFFYKFKVR